MKFNSMTRRHFLRTSGGFGLSLPFLPSLTPKAFADEPGSSLRYFVTLTYSHGGNQELLPGPEIEKALLGQRAGLQQSLLYPSAVEPLAGSSRATPDHFIRYGQLRDFLSNFSDPQDSKDNGNRRLSRVIGSSMTSLIEENKISILRGLDVPHVTGHPKCVLGNMRALQNGPANFGNLMAKSASIDYLMSNSPNVYGPSSFPSARIANLASNPQFNSYSYRPDPTNPDNVVALPSITGTDGVNTQHVFNILFPNFGAEDTNQNGELNFVDSLRDQFLSLRNSSRTDSGDKAKMDQFMEGLFQIQQSLNSSACLVPPFLSDKVPVESISYASHRTESYWEEMTSLLTLAFLCGKTQIATAMIRQTDLTHGFWSGSGRDYHHDIAHTSSYSRSSRDLHAFHTKNFFDHVFAPLANKMNEVGILDDAIVVGIGECGNAITHWGFDYMPVIAGGGGGNLEMGRYVDYRNFANTTLEDWRDITTFDGTRNGILYHQFLTNMMQAMGMQRSEYQDPARFGHDGYGAVLFDPKWARPWWSGSRTPWAQTRLLADINEPLPFFAKF